jgi:hypothetical protein
MLWLTQTVPGAARASSRAVMLTLVPYISRSSTRTSPVLMPIRSCMRSASSPYRSASPLWISSPQRTAFSALPNSTSMLSPMLRTKRPPYFKIIGSISSRACRAIRSCVASSSRLKAAIANDIGQQYCRKPARDRGTRPYHSRFRYLESPLRHGRSLQISADSE